MAPWSPVALPPRFVAARRSRLVGRRYELGVLETVWQRVTQGAGQVLLVGGEPGAGKTRLAAEAACVLHAQGAAVLVGTATKDAGVPYQPFVELLDHLLLASEPGTLDVAGELGLLSRHAARHLPDPAAAVGDGRRDLFEAVAGLFRSIARERPLVVVLDDVHWAQLPTVALLEHVVHSCVDTSTLVLVTFRTTAPDRSDELSARLADLHRLDGVRRLDLAGLDTEAIAEFVCDHAGVSPAAARTPRQPGWRCTPWRSRRRRSGSSGRRRCRRPRRTCGRSCRSTPPRTTCAPGTTSAPGGSTNDWPRRRTRWCAWRRRWGWRRPPRGPGWPTAGLPTCSVRHSTAAGSTRTTSCGCARSAASAGPWPSRAGTTRGGRSATGRWTRRTAAATGRRSSTRSRPVCGTD